MTADTYTYVYGVQRKGEPLPPELVGVEDACAVETIAGFRLQAITSQVPSRSFTAESLSLLLEDPAWLAPRVRAHEALIESCMAASSSLVPFRFCTIFEDRERARRELDDRESYFLWLLEKLDGMEEWEIRAYVDLDTLVHTAALSSPEAPEKRGSAGFAYMARKQLERTLAKEAENLAYRRIHEIQDVLSMLSRDQKELAAKDLDQEPWLREVRLIPRTNVPRFLERLDHFQDHLEPQGFDIRVTGPWPAYHFVE
ncbi:MAG: GvpL/GvpF family gas vesicle protein [Armatimonadetes bacterium]|nr:GvpL/GvpF family gas vesicle protein [Armatimonadota bacterium]